MAHLQDPGVPAIGEQHLPTAAAISSLKNGDLMGIHDGIAMVIDIGMYFYTYTHTHIYIYIYILKLIGIDRDFTSNNDDL